MQFESKILNGLERLTEALKSLIWEKAKEFGLSPIQIQILLFVSDHNKEICNVSYLAKEFNITKATISDAVRIMLKKELLEKDFSPMDNRRYNLMLTPKGKEHIGSLSGYASPILEELGNFDEKELYTVFNFISKLIFKLNQRNIIQVQRMCFNCKHYSGDRQSDHYCKFLESKLQKSEIRLDCNDFKE